MIDNKVVGQAIAQLRQAENMTQQTLAACLNVSHQAVSKWENGAALPDVLMLLEISKMFGVTLEQLLSGDVESRLNRNAPRTDAEKPIELKIDLNPFSEKAQDAINDAEKAVNETTDQPEQEEKEMPKEEENIDIDRIIEMAPFMSRQALDDMLAKYSGKCTPKQISRLAPFLSSQSLEKLIENSDGTINWDTLRRLAPFLGKEVVDKLTMAVAKGEKYVRPAARTIQKSTEEFSRVITKGVNKAVQSIKKMSEQINTSVNSAKVNIVVEPENQEAAEKPASRVSAARTRIFERALSEDKFDWIGEHIDQLGDSDIKGRILARAKELNMQDWIKEHMDDMCDEMTLDDALLSGDWEFIGEHLGGADADMRDVIIDTALTEGKWDWLGENVSDLDPEGETAAKLVNAAVNEGKWDWLLEHADEFEIPDEAAANMLKTAAQAEDWQFVDGIMDDVEMGAETKTALIEAALAQNNWDWLDAEMDELDVDGENLDAIIDAAIKAEEWDWLKRNIDDMDMNDPQEYAVRFYGLGQKELALEIAEEHLEDDADELLAIAINSGDTEFAKSLIEEIDGENAGETCLRLAREGKLREVAELAESFETDTVAQLVEVATEAGDWELIDKLNDLI